MHYQRRHGWSFFPFSLWGAKDENNDRCTISRMLFFFFLLATNFSLSFANSGKTKFNIRMQKKGGMHFHVNWAKAVMCFASLTRTTQCRHAEAPAHISTLWKPTKLLKKYCKVTLLLLCINKNFISYRYFNKEFWLNDFTAHLNLCFWMPLDFKVKSTELSCGSL